MPQARAEQEAILGGKAHQDQLMGWIWGGRRNERCRLGVCVSSWRMELQVLEGYIMGSLSDRLGLCGLLDRHARCRGGSGM